MKVLILGAGGVGGFLGALLARAGHELLFIDQEKSHVDAINHFGLKVSGQESFTIQARAKARPARELWSSVDLLILATKYIDSCEALASIEELDVRWATSIQNGLDVHDRLIARFGKDRVFGMITLISGSLKGPGEVIGYWGERPTFLGEVDGRQSPRIEKLAGQLEAAGLKVIVPDHIESVRWTKMVWWIPLVVLPAITRLTWGEAFVQPDLAALYTRIERECAEVATALGHPVKNYDSMPVSKRLSLSFDEAVLDVLEMGRKLIAEGTRDKEVAMLLDLKKRRRTEAESTIGLMVKKAQEAGIPVPYTECAWRLIHSVESTF